MNELTKALLTVPPPADWCERKQWIGDCPNTNCRERLKEGKLCGRTLGDLFDMGDHDKRFVVQRHREIIGWALGVDQSRVYQIERDALLKLRKVARV